MRTIKHFKSKIKLTFCKRTNTNRNLATGKFGKDQQAMKQTMNVTMRLMNAQ